MPRLGELVHVAQDDQGELHVYDDGRFRYLTFGNQVEQSCLDLADPARLVHVYTQAMMLACLLSPRVDDVLLAGLGGGSLARAFRAYRPDARIVGIEQREAVIEVARAWFDLATDRRLRAEPGEAGDYLARSDRQFDLILSDLYLAEGVDPRQNQAGFLDNACRRLTSQGVLVINQWASEFAGNGEASQGLAEIFDERVLQLHVQGGNIISFAFRGELPRLQRKTFFARALGMGLKLKIPMARHARNLWRQNAQTLGVARYRR